MHWVLKVKTRYWFGVSVYATPMYEFPRKVIEGTEWGKSGGHACSLLMPTADYLPAHLVDNLNNEVDVSPPSWPQLS